MKRDDLVILFIALLLLAGMLITFFFGGGRSRHGVGLFFKDEIRLGSNLAENHQNGGKIRGNYSHFFFLKNHT